MTTPAAPNLNLRRFVSRSGHPAARAARALYLGVGSFTLPAPRVVVKPVLQVFLAARSVVYFAKRVLVCEPLFKAYCAKHGRRVRTDIYIHWVNGSGDLIVGDDVVIEGKCSFTFASRISDRPTLRIGDHCHIGHNCSFTVGKEITIGSHCMIASDNWFFDSSGHPADPADRLAGVPPAAEDSKPVVLGDNVWVGRRCIIYPGVSIGTGSIVSAGSVVTNSVPANTIVAGNPARRIAALGPGPAGPA